MFLYIDKNYIVATMIRLNSFDGTEVYTKTRRIGTTVNSSGELNKTYYDNK